MNKDPRERAIIPSATWFNILVVSFRFGSPASFQFQVSILKGVLDKSPMCRRTWLRIVNFEASRLGDKSASPALVLPPTPCLGHNCKPHAADLPFQGPWCKLHLIKETTSKWPHSIVSRCTSKSLLLFLTFDLSFKAPPAIF